MTSKAHQSVKERSKYIGGSDAARILNGDWLALYNEKKGIQPPENLDHVFRVQLGVYTENFHAAWLRDELGMKISDSDLYKVDAEHHFMVAHIDRWYDSEDAPIELKHSNPWSAREAAEFYLPQLAHYSMVCKRKAVWLSVIPGNDDPMLVKVEPPAEYIEKLRALEVAFWWHITEGVAPELLPTGTMAAAEALVGKTVVNNFRQVDMQGNNEWAAMAVDYTDNEAGAKLFDEAKKKLKALVPADASDAKGHGIHIQRSASGSLLFKKAK